MFKRQFTSRFQTFGGILLTQLQHGHCGIDALFGSAVALEDTVNDSQCLLSNGCRPLSDRQLIPFRFLEAFRNIFRIGVIPVANIARETLVGGDTLMAAVDLDHAVGDLKVNGLAYKAVRNGVLAGLVGHMKIRADHAPVFPHSILIRNGRKWAQRDAFICFKYLTAAAFTLLEGLIVEILQA